MLTAMYIITCTHQKPLLDCKLITRLHVQFGGVYDSFKVCMKVSMYLYCSMLFDLRHCSYLCISITVCLPPVSLCSK
jgi:hypothetical protein